VIDVSGDAGGDADFLVTLDVVPAWERRTAGSPQSGFEPQSKTSLGKLVSQSLR
jgi:hypothetical protein